MEVFTRQKHRNKAVERLPGTAMDAAVPHLTNGFYSYTIKRNLSKFP